MLLLVLLQVYRPAKTSEQNNPVDHLVPPPPSLRPLQSPLSGIKTIMAQVNFNFLLI